MPRRWRAVLEQNVPLYRQLPRQVQREIDGHIQVLLHEKHLEGCAGLQLTDEIRVTVAAHGALLLVGRDHYYPLLKSILVYPSSYFVPERTEEGGIVTEHQEERLGESWGSGVVVVSWDDSRDGGRDPADGRNTFIHEFAHQLDTENGPADGLPYLDTPADVVAWSKSFGAAYEDLRAGRCRCLDEYGATDPAEFFAVVTETFFEQPDALRKNHPEIYRQLSRLFNLDLARSPG